MSDQQRKTMIPDSESLLQDYELYFEYDRRISEAKKIVHKRTSRKN